MKRVVLSAGGSRILGPDPGRLLHVNPENAGDLRMLSWLPENVSTYGGDIDSILYLIYYITGAWFFLTLGTIVLFLFLYRRREGRPATYDGHLPVGVEALHHARHDVRRVVALDIDFRGAE